MAQHPPSPREVLAEAAPTVRKLFTVIVRQVDHGPIRFKAEGVATPPEILEACGLDVGEFYDILNWLTEHGLIEVTGAYPFEEIRLTPAARAEFLSAAQVNDIYRHTPQRAL